MKNKREWGWVRKIRGTALTPGTAQSIAQGPLQNLPGGGPEGWVWTQAPTRDALAPGILGEEGVGVEGKRSRERQGQPRIGSDRTRDRPMGIGFEPLCWIFFYFWIQPPSWNNIFLLPLSPAELLGNVLPNRHCAVCHYRYPFWVIP